MCAAVQVQRAGERFHTRMGWLDSWHNFSFGRHYDAAHVGHGLLLVSNDDRVAPGTGFGTHGHRDMEIVTWVLDGALEHRDTSGGHGVITPGLAQRMSAGTGVQHSEMNASPDVEVHFVQMWVLPDTLGVRPGYEQADVSEALRAGALVHVAGPAGSGAAVAIHQAAADLYAVRLAPEASVEVPHAPFVHVFVPRGDASLDTAERVVLAEGDAARLTDVGTVRLTGGAEGAEVLVWATGPRP